MKLSITVLSLLLFFAASARAVPMQGLNHSVLNVPVLLITDIGGAGSGAYIDNNRNLYVITAKHVLFDAQGALKGAKLTLISYAGDEVKQQMKYLVDLPLAKKTNNIFIAPGNDIAIIKIANGSINKVSGKFEYYLSEGVTSVGAIIPVMTVNSSSINSLAYKDVKISNDVFLLGYPISLGMDLVNKKLLDVSKPLLRKGIVAGKNDQNRTVIIDCPVYKGNSGGPVFEIDLEEDGSYKAKLIGIVTDFIPLVEKWKSSLYEYENMNLSNSGYGVVVPLDDILSFLNTK